MVALIVLCSLVLLAILIYIDYLIATEFDNIAEQKGYSESNKYFWYCFWLGIVGYLMVIALPNCPSSKTTKQSNKVKQPNKAIIKENISTSQYIEATCPHCEGMISIERGTTKLDCPWCDKKIELE